VFSAKSETPLLPILDAFSFHSHGHFDHFRGQISTGMEILPSWNFCRFQGSNFHGHGNLSFSGVKFPRAWKFCPFQGSNVHGHGNFDPFRGQISTGVDILPFPGVKLQRTCIGSSKIFWDFPKMFLQIPRQLLEFPRTFFELPRKFLEFPSRLLEFPSGQIATGMEFWRFPAVKFPRAWIFYLFQGSNFHGCGFVALSRGQNFHGRGFFAFSRCKMSTGMEIYFLGALEAKFPWAGVNRKNRQGFGINVP
jgi:hypothetical protein